MLGANASGFFGVGTPSGQVVAELLFAPVGLLRISPMLALAAVGLVLAWRRGFRAESLTIAAVCERAAHGLTARGHELGLPRRPEGFRHRTPGRFLGERYVPKKGGGLKVVRG